MAISESRHLDEFLSSDQHCVNAARGGCVSAEKLTKGKGESGRLMEVIMPGLPYRDSVRDKMEYVKAVD